MRFTAEQAREARQKYLERQKESIGKITDKVYEKIIKNANKGMTKVVFSMIDINCPICLEKAVIEQLTEDGYMITYCLGDYTVKW